MMFTPMQSLARKAAYVGLLAVLTLGLAGCAGRAHPNIATADDDGVLVSDPLAPFNRSMTNLNTALDRAIFNPVVTAYRYVVPQPGRDAVHNVLDNLKSPVYLANELLQGDLKGAGRVITRFAVNTTVGIAGIMDVAGKSGLKAQPEDFGQTLAVWGVGNGPYIVWPIVGPSTLRDSVGFVGDIAMDPIYWYAHNNDREWIQWTRGGLTFIDTKDRTRDALEDLRNNSGDPYNALKSVYIQRRNALINDLDATKAELPDIE